MAFYTEGGDKLSNEIVVVLEDSPTSLKVLSSILGRLKFKVYEFKHPQVALKWLSTNPDVKPKIFISDIIMPDMSGLEFLKFYREQNYFPETPFLLLTSKVDKESILEARDLKTSGYILKPASIEALGKKISELFPDRKIE